jgi:hypothetical protein
MRLAHAGAVTAIVPLARVHHGFAASVRRRHDRVPLDLTCIGQSLHVFVRKHAEPADHAAVGAAHRRQQKLRLLSHMVAGRIMPGDVARLLAGFDRGWQAGATLPLATSAIDDAVPAFLTFVPAVAPGAHKVIHGRFWQARALRRQAVRDVTAGSRVTLILLSLTALYHRITFDPDGYWVQRGGQFGRSDRDDPVFRFWSQIGRAAREAGRIA